MAYRCVVCSKGPVAGFSYSHSNRATKRIFRPNLQKQRVVLSESGRTITGYVCTHCIKSGRTKRPAR